ncbi:MAG: hypothetical protein AAF602_23765 [Myxococcota bacterium]
MLIGKSRRRPNLETIRRIKRALREALALPDDATVTIAELACREEGCAPVETVFGLLPLNAAQLQHKVHKPVDAIEAADLVDVGAAWGFDPTTSDFEPFAKEKE